MKRVNMRSGCGRCDSKPCWTLWAERDEGYAEWCPRCGFVAYGAAKGPLLEYLTKYVKRSPACVVARLTEAA